MGTLAYMVTGALLSILAGDFFTPVILIATYEAVRFFFPSLFTPVKVIATYEVVGFFFPSLIVGPYKAVRSIFFWPLIITYKSVRFIFLFLLTVACKVVRVIFLSPLIGAYEVVKFIFLWLLFGVYEAIKFIFLPPLTGTYKIVRFIFLKSLVEAYKVVKFIFLSLLFGIYEAIKFIFLSPLTETYNIVRFIFLPSLIEAYKIVKFIFPWVLIEVYKTIRSIFFWLIGAYKIVKSIFFSPLIREIYKYVRSIFLSLFIEAYEDVWIIFSWLLVGALFIIIAVAIHKTYKSILLYNFHPVAMDNKSSANIHQQATVAKRAPRSSCFTREWTYDVFLNFRGDDTRFDFARNLYEALRRKGIHTFMDDEEIRRGEEITPALVKAIQESRIAITIFSENYASSTFCLDELVKILEFIKENGRLVLPIFYCVDPSQVRHQRENYREAFAKHEKRFTKEKVREWRQALQDAANLSGFEFIPGSRYEYHFIEEIIKEVSNRINRRPLYITHFSVELQPQLRQVMTLVDVGSNEGVKMIGICGKGGRGKTTIAKAIYNMVADLFDGICFLGDVKENSTKYGCSHLQEMLLLKTIEEDIRLAYVHEGIPIIKHRLHQKKILLVLDDVDKKEQLDALAGGLDWFGFGSRIIITSRNKDLLASHGVERIHKVESLNNLQDSNLRRTRIGSFGKRKLYLSWV